VRDCTKKTKTSIFGAACSCAFRPCVQYPVFYIGLCPKLGFGV